MIGPNLFFSTGLAARTAPETEIPHQKKPLTAGLGMYLDSGMHCERILVSGVSNNCKAKFINQSNCIPTFTLLLDFDRSCHNQNVFQGYINLIGYTYLSLEYSAFVCTAQKALTKRISNPSGSTK